jgi:hypothetical protein
MQSYRAKCNLCEYFIDFEEDDENDADALIRTHAVMHIQICHAELLAPLIMEVFGHDS